jgi:hypothetical protein
MQPNKKMQRTCEKNLLMISTVLRAADLGC